MSKKYRENNGDFGVVKKLIPVYIRKPIIDGRLNKHYIAGWDKMTGSLLYHTLQLDLENIPAKLREIKKSQKTPKPIEPQKHLFSDSVLEALTLDGKKATKAEYDIDNEFPFTKTNVAP